MSERSLLITKWLEALRSGKYPQGRSRLHGHGGYCCLGVLCDIVDPSKWKDLEYDGDVSLPPKYIMDMAGLKIDDVKYLASKNDYGVPFKDIADIIEARYGLGSEDTSPNV